MQYCSHNCPRVRLGFIHWVTWLRAGGEVIAVCINGVVSGYKCIAAHAVYCKCYCKFSDTSGPLPKSQLLHPSGRSCPLLNLPNPISEDPSDTNLRCGPGAAPYGEAKPQKTLQILGPTQRWALLVSGNSQYICTPVWPTKHGPKKHEPEREGSQYADLCRASGPGRP